MAKVKFLTRTRYKGELVEPGRIADVPEKKAKRWERNGIAKRVKTQSGKKAQTKETADKGGE